MPQVLADLQRFANPAALELLVLENDLFGPSVTTAGLLPGRSIQRALNERSDLDLALIPAEALNDDDLFIDDLGLAELRATAGQEIRPSYCFADVLTESGVT